MTAKKRITIEYLTHLKDTGIPALATAECMLLDQPGLREYKRNTVRASQEAQQSVQRAIDLVEAIGGDSE